MNNALVEMADGDLRELAAALRTGRVAAPFTAIGIQRLVAQRADAVVEGLRQLSDQGLSAGQIALVLELVLADRERRTIPEDLVDLVVTGPEGGAVANRDTRVVVRELFASATQSVLVVGYAVYKGQQVFQALADRMAAVPGLKVQLFLDIARRPGDTSLATELVRRFLDRFKQSEWPADRPLPEIHYFPLSQEESPAERAVLHAKCVVIDRTQVFISSANFTEAAQIRNIEVGLLVRSKSLAQQLAKHFEALAESGVLKRVL